MNQNFFNGTNFQNGVNPESNESTNVVSSSLPNRMNWILPSNEPPKISTSSRGMSNYGVDSTNVSAVGIDSTRVDSLASALRSSNYEQSLTQPKDSTFIDTKYSPMYLELSEKEAKIEDQKSDPTLPFPRSNDQKKLTFNAIKSYIDNPETPGLTKDNFNYSDFMSDDLSQKKTMIVSKSPAPPKKDPYKLNNPIVISENRKGLGINASGQPDYTASDMGCGDKDLINDIENWFDIVLYHPNKFMEKFSLDTFTNKVLKIVGGVDDINVVEDLVKKIKNNIPTRNISAFINNNSSIMETLFREGVKPYYINADARMKRAIEKIVDKFLRKEGGVFSDEDLTNSVLSHPETQKFIQEVKRALAVKVKEYKGKLPKDFSLMPTGVKLPSILFNRPEDYLNGYIFAIHAMQKYEIKLISYNYDETTKKYQCKLKITHYDNFGLDLLDVKKYWMLPGFAPWYFLQHHNQYKYPPFVTKMSYIITIEGYVS